jgi:hypothetical protein
LALHFDSRLEEQTGRTTVFEEPVHRKLGYH